MKFTLKKSIAFGLLTVFVATGVFAARSTYYRREFNPTNGQIWLLQNDGTVTQKGAIKFGNNEDNVTTLPTTTTADNFGIKIPFQNIGSLTTTRGQVVLGVSTATIVGAGNVLAILSTTTVIGIADGAYTNGTKGWVTVGGLAAALTTGTVNIGDLLVTTTTAMGYLGVAPSTSAAAGSLVGRAMSQGTTTGGLTVIELIK